MPPPNSSAAGVRLPLAATLTLALAFAAALVLALDQVGALEAPGCGRGGACAEAARSALGKVPVLGWPTSFVGTAWFAALLAAWAVARGRWTRAFRAFANGGTAVSLILLAALFAEGTPCPWCLAVHASNLGFWWLSLRAGRAASGGSAELLPRAPWVAFALVFAAATAALAWGARAGRARALERAEQELASSTSAIRAARGTASDREGGFTGRWRAGPERARARVVAFTDYQCSDCKRVEEELEAYAGAHADVALSIKHFPMCPQCNPHAPDMHPNACWAARAAEAAGRLGGTDGFWRVHRWLFARSGSFTKEELRTALPGLGFDAASFERELNSPASLAPVTADVEEAMHLGLARTPMLFVNGVELRGWDAPDAIERALDAVRASAGEADGTADRPPPARDKILGDWRAEPVRVLPPDRFPRDLGPADAPVGITLFGDYQDEFTVAADKAVRELVLARTDVRYSFRHYPTNPACNPVVPRTIHPLACLAALGAEMSAAVQALDGFWAMHDWLMEHRAGFDDAVLLAHAKEMGIEEPLFWDVMKAPELNEAIQDDVLAAKELDVESIPAIWVAGKRLARWQLDGESLLPAVIDEARALRKR